MSQNGFIRSRKGIVLGIILAAILIAMEFWQISRMTPSQEVRKDLPVYGQTGEFSLLDQDGHSVTDQDLKGKVWIADFIFTRCAGPCIWMSNQVEELQNTFSGQSGIRFVSFTVDPEYDRPEILKHYAGKFDADTDRWIFLTGDKEQMRTLAEQKFHVGAEPATVEERVQDPAHAISHSTKFVLVDKDLNIRGYYDSQNNENLTQLIRDAMNLIKQV